MRISAQQQDFFASYWKEKSPHCEVYLFGSRVDDSKKGGDIDILLLTDEKIYHGDMYKMKQTFFAQFGEQKLDIINFEKKDESAFKKYLLSYAKRL